MASPAKEFKKRYFSPLSTVNRGDAIYTIFANQIPNDHQKYSSNFVFLFGCLAKTLISKFKIHLLAGWKDLNI